MLVKDYKNAFSIIIFSLFNWDEIVIIFIKADDGELTIVDDHGDGLVRLKEDIETKRISYLIPLKLSNTFKDWFSFILLKHFIY